MRCLVVLMGLCCLSVQADIYRSVDAQGGVSFSDTFSANASKHEVQQQPYRYRVSVKRVIDGDTIVLNNGEKIRLIGLNTPEVDSHFSRAEAGGEQAKEWLTQQLTSSSLFIEYDIEQRDNYDRALAYCFLENGDFINARLLEMGLATLTLRQPNLYYAEALEQAQQRAESAKRGVWAQTDYALHQQNELIPGKRYPGWQRWLVMPKAINESTHYFNLHVTEHFVIRIPKETAALFLPLSELLNTNIEVRGWLKKNKDRYSMTVQHPSALILH